MNTIKIKHTFQEDAQISAIAIEDVEPPDQQKRQAMHK